MDRLTFSPSECADAVKIVIDFCQRRGTLRPVPFRMRMLIYSLNVNTFKGRERTDAARVEMTERIAAALRPWGS